jgi:hypothetical protein
VRAPRPAPPVTITVPGRPAAPPSAPAEDEPPRSPRQVLAGLAVVAVVGTGAAVATAEELPPPAPPSSADGLVVEVSLDDRPQGDVLAVRLQVLVGSPSGRLGPEERRIHLASMTGRGLLAVPVGRWLAPLVELGPAGEARSFRVDVVVDDCAVEPSAPRQLELVVERADRGPGTLRPTSDADVVRALDRLVSRTCGRQRG